MSTKYLIALVGNQYRGAHEKAALKALPNGAPLTLIREPTNEHDPLAVQVWGAGEHLGFLKGTQNGPVAHFMDGMADAAGERVTLEAKLAIDGGKWPMVEVEF